MSEVNRGIKLSPESPAAQAILGALGYGHAKMCATCRHAVASDAPDAKHTHLCSGTNKFLIQVQGTSCCAAGWWTVRPAPSQGPAERLNKAYACPLCARSYTAPSQLNRHIRINHPTALPRVSPHGDKNESTREGPLPGAKTVDSGAPSDPGPTPPSPISTSTADPDGKAEVASKANATPRSLPRDAKHTLVSGEVRRTRGIRRLSAADVATIPVLTKESAIIEVKALFTKVLKHAKVGHRITYRKMCKWLKCDQPLKALLYELLYLVKLESSGTPACASNRWRINADHPDVTDLPAKLFFYCGIPSSISKYTLEDTSLVARSMADKYNAHHPGLVAESGAPSTATSAGCRERISATLEDFGVKGQQPDASTATADGPVPAASVPPCLPVPPARLLTAAELLFTSQLEAWFASARKGEIATWAACRAFMRNGRVATYAYTLVANCTAVGIIKNGVWSCSPDQLVADPNNYKGLARLLVEQTGRPHNMHAQPVGDLQRCARTAASAFNKYYATLA